MLTKLLGIEAADALAATAIVGALRYRARRGDITRTRPPRSCTDNIHSGGIIAKHLTIPYDARPVSKALYRHTGFRSTVYYIYRFMKESGLQSIFFYGVLCVYRSMDTGVRDIRHGLIGTILDKFMAIGLIILGHTLSKEPIKRFLVELGSQRRWRFLSKLFHHHREEIDNKALT